MPSRPRAFFRAGSPPPDGRLCREIALARSLRPSSSIGRFHGYRLELLAPVDVKPTRPWRVAIRGSRATDFKSEQKLNADDGRRGLTGHGSRPRDATKATQAAQGAGGETRATTICDATATPIPALSSSAVPATT